jgi:hypothetical protein
VNDQIVYIAAPRPHRANRAEAVLYVRNYAGNLDALLRSHPNLQNLREKLMPQWRQPKR